MLGTEDRRARVDLPGLERVGVAHIARQALGSQTADLNEWRVEVVGAGMGAATGGIYRVTGRARDRGLDVP